MNNFYTPQDVRPYYDDIIPAYQAAFAGEPWFEVSKCADTKIRCAGGFSKIAVGQTCTICKLSPTAPAYESDELADRFETIAATKPTSWYLEQNQEGLSLAAIAWQAPASTIASEKYADMPAMGQWLSDQLGNKPIAWLDEVFANRTIKTKGNLRRFGEMCLGFMERLNVDTLAYRTVNPRMVAAARRDFGALATDYIRDRTVPDRRDFVVINKESV